MIPADIRKVINLSDFNLKIKSWIPDGCLCNICHAYTCKVGYINQLMSRNDNFIISVLFFTIFVNMLMNGIKICFIVHLFKTVFINSSLICDFVKTTLIY